VGSSGSQSSEAMDAGSADASGCEAGPVMAGQGTCVFCDNAWWCTEPGLNNAGFPSCPADFDGGTACIPIEQCIVCNANKTSTVWSCRSSTNWSSVESLQACGP
jgi:hypothetical protein